MTPRLSLGVPLYNAERYLDECFAALLGQDYQDFEIIVSDNASTDRTWEICQRHAAHDPRFRLHRFAENQGGHANFRRVAELARGELFKWVPYDDLCAPTFLSRCVDALDAAGPRAVAAYPRTLLIDSGGAVVGPYEDRMDLRQRRPWRRVAGMANNVNLCHAHLGVVRLAALRRTGLIRPYISSDYTLLMELAALGEIHEVPERLFLRRIHESSTHQGEQGSAAAAAAWFGPTRQKIGGYRRRMVAATVRALLTRDLPLATRISCAAAFGGTWYARRIRVALGRWRRITSRRLALRPGTG